MQSWRERLGVSCFLFLCCIPLLFFLFFLFSHSLPPFSFLISMLHYCPSLLLIILIALSQQSHPPSLPSLLHLPLKPSLSLPSLSLSFLSLLQQFLKSPSCLLALLTIISIQQLQGGGLVHVGTGTGTVYPFSFSIFLFSSSNFSFLSFSLSFLRDMPTPPLAYFSNLVCFSLSH